MRLTVFGTLLALLVFASCEPTIDIPDQYEGRYYGYDTIISNDILFAKIDTQVVELYLDVVNLRNNEYDIFNNNGYWVREGLMLGDGIKINIDPFEGKINMTTTELDLSAQATTNGIVITHSAILNR